MNKKQQTQNKKQQTQEINKQQEIDKQARVDGFMDGFDAVTDCLLPLAVVRRVAETEISIDGKLQTLADLVCKGAERSARADAQEKFVLGGLAEEKFLGLCGANRVAIKVYGIVDKNAPKYFGYPLLSPELFKERMVLTTTLQIRVKWDSQSRSKDHIGCQDCCIKSQGKGWWIWGAGRFGVEVRGHNFVTSRDEPYYDPDVPHICLLELPKEEQTPDHRFELHILIPSIPS